MPGVSRCDAFTLDWQLCDLEGVCTTNRRLAPNTTSITTTDLTIETGTGGGWQPLPPGVRYHSRLVASGCSEDSASVTTLGGFVCDQTPPHIEPGARVTLASDRRRNNRTLGASNGYAFANDSLRVEWAGVVADPESGLSTARICISTVPIASCEGRWVDASADLGSISLALPADYWQAQASISALRPTIEIAAVVKVVNGAGLEATLESDAVTVLRHLPMLNSFEVEDYDSNAMARPCLLNRSHSLHFRWTARVPETIRGYELRAFDAGNGSLMLSTAISAEAREHIHQRELRLPPLEASLPPGYTTFALVATDLAGQQTSLQLTCIIDPTPPSIGELWVNNAALTASGSYAVNPAAGPLSICWQGFGSYSGVSQYVLTVCQPSKRAAEPDGVPDCNNARRQELIVGASRNSCFNSSLDITENGDLGSRTYAVRLVAISQAGIASATAEVALVTDSSAPEPKLKETAALVHPTLDIGLGISARASACCLHASWLPWEELESELAGYHLCFDRLGRDITGRVGEPPHSCLEVGNATAVVVRNVGNATNVGEANCECTAEAGAVVFDHVLPLLSPLGFVATAGADSLLLRFYLGASNIVGLRGELEPQEVAVERAPPPTVTAVRLLAPSSDINGSTECGAPIGAALVHPAGHPLRWQMADVDTYNVAYWRACVWSVERAESAVSPPCSTLRVPRLVSLATLQTAAIKTAGYYQVNLTAVSLSAIASPAHSQLVSVDATPPKVGALLTASRYYSSDTGLFTCSWAAAVDVESGIASYEVELVHAGRVAGVTAGWDRGGAVLDTSGQLPCTAQSHTFTHTLLHAHSYRCALVVTNLAGLRSLGLSPDVDIDASPQRMLSGQLAVPTLRDGTNVTIFNNADQNPKRVLWVPAWTSAPAHGTSEHEHEHPSPLSPPPPSAPPPSPPPPPSAPSPSPPPPAPPPPSAPPANPTSAPQAPPPPPSTPPLPPLPSPPPPSPPPATPPHPPPSPSPSPPPSAPPPSPPPPSPSPPPSPPPSDRRSYMTYDVQLRTPPQTTPHGLVIRPGFKSVACPYLGLPGCEDGTLLDPMPLQPLSRIDVSVYKLAVSNSTSRADSGTDALPDDTPLFHETRLMANGDTSPCCAGQNGMPGSGLHTHDGWLADTAFRAGSPAGGAPLESVLRMGSVLSASPGSRPAAVLSTGFESMFYGAPAAEAAHVVGATVGEPALVFESASVLAKHMPCIPSGPVDALAVDAAGTQWAVVACGAVLVGAISPLDEAPWRSYDALHSTFALTDLVAASVSGDDPATECFHATPRLVFASATQLLLYLTCGASIDSSKTAVATWLSLNADGTSSSALVKAAATVEGACVHCVATSETVLAIGRSDECATGAGAGTGAVDVYDMAPSLPPGAWVPSATVILDSSDAELPPGWCGFGRVLALAPGLLIVGVPDAPAPDREGRLASSSPPGGVLVYDTRDLSDVRLLCRLNPPTAAMRRFGMSIATKNTSQSLLVAVGAHLEDDADGEGGGGEGSVLVVAVHQILYRNGVAERCIERVSDTITIPPRSKMVQLSPPPPSIPPMSPPSSPLPPALPPPPPPPSSPPNPPACPPRPPAPPPPPSPLAPPAAPPQPPAPPLPPRAPEYICLDSCQKLILMDTSLFGPLSSITGDSSIPSADGNRPVPISSGIADYVADGVCDDGGPNETQPVDRACPFGFDCTDCGPRLGRLRAPPLPPPNTLADAPPWYQPSPPPPPPSAPRLALPSQPPPPPRQPFFAPLPPSAPSPPLLSPHPLPFAPPPPNSPPRLPWLASRDAALPSRQLLFTSSVLILADAGALSLTVFCAEGEHRRAGTSLHGSH